MDYADMMENYIICTIHGTSDIHENYKIFNIKSNDMEIRFIFLGFGG